MQECGLNIIWVTQDFGDKNAFLKEIYQRLYDLALQELLAENRNSSLFNRYAVYKTTFRLECYLTRTKSQKYRVALSKLRLCANDLRINKGIRNHWGLQDRICELCNQGQVEDEHHFLMKCTFYADLRENILPQFNGHHDSLYSFNRLMSSLTNEDLMYRVGKYSYLAMERRKLHYHNTME